jgi:hypothetical protein
MQRQLLGRAQHLHVADEDLDLAGGDLGVHQAFVARLHLAVDADAPFGAHLFDLGEDRAVGIAQHLGDAVMVAQVDEQHAAMVAPMRCTQPDRRTVSPTLVWVRAAQVWLR